MNSRSEIFNDHPAGSENVRTLKDPNDKASIQKLIFSSAPFLLEGAANDWTAMKLWNPGYLEKMFGGLFQTADRTINGKRETRKFAIREYLDYMATTSDKLPFYLGNVQLHIGTEMQDHYIPPSFCSCWYKNFSTEKKKYDLSWLFIGAANSRSVLHVDRWNTSAWNAVISGLKLWMFYKPEQGELMYDGKVDPFDPDHYSYPEFARSKSLICLQRPGDIVFTPAGWWHAAMNIEKSISLTENYINRTNYRQVLEFFKKHKKLNSLDTLKMIVNKNLHSRSTS